MAIKGLTTVCRGPNDRLEETVANFAIGDPVSATSHVGPGTKPLSSSLPDSDQNVVSLVYPSECVGECRIIFGSDSIQSGRAVKSNDCD